MLYLFKKIANFFFVDIIIIMLIIGFVVNVKNPVFQNFSYESQSSSSKLNVSIIYEEVARHISSATGVSLDTMNDLGIIGSTLYNQVEDARIRLNTLVIK